MPCGILSKSIRTVSFVLSAVTLLASCSKEEKFRIEGEICDGSSHIIELTWLKNGSFNRVVAHSDEAGKWTLEGTANSPTLALLSIGGEEALVSLVVENGDRIRIEMPADAATGEIKVRGNRTSELLARFDSETRKSIASGRGTDINRRVEEFIRKNPKEIASAVLLVTRFDSRGHEVQADSLMGLIAPSARPVGVMQNFAATIANQLSTESSSDLTSMVLYDRRDTTIRYNPSRQSYTLFAFLDARKRLRDSVVPELRKLKEAWPDKRLAAIEVSLARDSATWKQSTESDSATWIQAWAPGAVSSSNFRKMAIRRVPYFVVADSSGRQIYRGSSISAATKELLKGLTKGKD